ncbi:hypothetical protein P4234_21950 [Pseudomonas aeruginosa]|nr:hypothetical protein [Pseudomonas aeruginosa]
MTHPLRLLWLCSALFVVLGLGFVFFPGPLASLLTSGEPLTPPPSPTCAPATAAPASASGCCSAMPPCAPATWCSACSPPWR